MSDQPLGILVITEKIDPSDLNRLVREYFGYMVKYVVDIHQRVVAIGGELHADGEQLLLERGSRQVDIWGANYHPGAGIDQCIEYTALINIRPAEGNRSMEISDEEIRAKIREITFELIGRGEEQ